MLEINDFLPYEQLRMSVPLWMPVTWSTGAVTKSAVLHEGHRE